jgi:gas vesicle protein
MNSQSSSGFLAGFIIGGLVGAVLALLLAPQPGTETRAQLKNKGLEFQQGLGEAGRMAQGQVASLQEKGQATLDWGKQSAGGVIDRVKSPLLIVCFFRRAGAARKPVRWNRQMSTVDSKALKQQLRALYSGPIGLFARQPGSLVLDPQQMKDVAGSRLYALFDFMGILYRLLRAPVKRVYLVKEYGWLDLLGSLPVPGLRLARLFRVVQAGRLLRKNNLPGVLRVFLRRRAEGTLLVVGFLILVALEWAAMPYFYLNRPMRANIKTAGMHCGGLM